RRRAVRVRAGAPPPTRGPPRGAALDGLDRDRARPRRHRRRLPPVRPRLAPAHDLAHARRAPRPLALLEHKFYWDELYAAVFYRPAVLAAQGLARFVEAPLIAGSI